MLSFPRHHSWRLRRDIRRVDRYTWAQAGFGQRITRWEWMRAAKRKSKSKGRKK